MCIVFFIVALLAAIAITLFFSAKKYYNHFFAWSREVWHWLCQAREVFGGIFFVVASVVICWILDWNSKAFIIAGCVLQLAGMAQAILSLFDVRKYFEPQPIIDSVKEWLKKFPKFNRLSEATISTHSGDAICLVSGGSGIIKDDPHKSLDERIANLYKNILLLEIISNSYHSRIENVFNMSLDIRGQIDVMKVENKKELKQLHVGDFIPTLIGLAWIAAGIVLATIGSL